MYRYFIFLMIFFTFSKWASSKPEDYSVDKTLKELNAATNAVISGSLKMDDEWIWGKDIFMLSPKEKALLEKKVNEGDAQAAFKLYEYYYHGGVNKKIGMQWLRVAANKGHVIAQYSLGTILTQSTDPKEKSEGLKWLQLTEKHGMGVDYNPLMPKKKTEKKP